MKVLKVTKVNLYPLIVSMLGPDEHLEGECTGASLCRGAVIIAKDAPRRSNIRRSKYRQLTIHDFFKPAPPKKLYLQLSIWHYFKRVK